MQRSANLSTVIKSHGFEGRFFIVFSFFLKLLGFFLFLTFHYGVFAKEMLNYVATVGLKLAFPLFCIL